MTFPTLQVIDAKSQLQTINVVPDNWPGWDAATSTPIIQIISDTSAHILGPFAPQLTRPIWITLNATASASGAAQILRSTDAGLTKLAITSKSVPIGNYAFGGDLGVIVNEPIIIETDASATYYLSITLTAGTVSVRIAQ